MPRTEFSPHLELIRTSEVDPHKGPGSGKVTKTGLMPIPEIQINAVEMKTRVVEESYQNHGTTVKRLDREASSRHDMRKMTTLAAVVTLLCSSILFSDEDLLASGPAR